MDRPAIDALTYIRLADRLCELQRKWEKAAKEAFKVRGKKSSERIRAASPCGRLASLVRELSAPEGGSYAPLGKVIQTYSEFPVALGLNDSPEALSKRAREILNEARRNNGTYYREVLIKYIWEHREWKPSTDESEWLFRKFGNILEPFLPGIQLSNSGQNHNIDRSDEEKRQEGINEDLGSPEERVIEATGRIIDEALNKSGTLNLSMLFLNSIPHGIERLTHIKSLELCLNYNLDLEFLASFHNLEKLTINYCKNDLSFLRFVPNLRYLDVSYSNFNDLSALEYVPNLVELDLGACKVNDVIGLRWLNKLDNLNVSSLHVAGHTIKDFNLLALVPSITHLYAGFTDVRNLNGLESCRNLKIVSLARCKYLSDIREASSCYQIAALDVSHTPIQGVESICSLPKLTYLDISRTWISDISPLCKAPSLRRLICNFCYIKQGMSELIRAGRLKYLSADQSIIDGYEYWNLEDYSGLDALSVLKSMDPYNKIIALVRERVKELRSDVWKSGTVFKSAGHEFQDSITSQKPNMIISGLKTPFVY